MSLYVFAPYKNGVYTVGGLGTTPAYVTGDAAIAINNSLIALANAGGIGGVTYLVASNNLSDLTSASAARTNLGLGTAATANTGTSNGNVPVISSGSIAMGGNNISGAGSIAATTFTGALTGHASSDLALSGGTMTGTLLMGANTISFSSGSLTLASSTITMDSSSSIPFVNLDTVASIAADGSGDVTISCNSLVITQPAGYVSPPTIDIAGIVSFGAVQNDSTWTLTATKGSGAGSVSASVSISGYGNAGQVSVTTAGSPSPNATVVTIGNLQFSNASYAVLEPANSAAAALSGANQVFVSTNTSGQFVIKSGGTALTTSTTYIWNFIVMGR